MPSRRTARKQEPHQAEQNTKLQKVAARLLDEAIFFPGIRERLKDQPLDIVKGYLWLQLKQILPQPGKTFILKEEKHPRAFEILSPLSRKEWAAFPEILSRKGDEWITSHFTIRPVPTSPKITPPKPTADDGKMAEQGDKVFTHDGVRYRPLPQAAHLAQAPRQTLLNWIKNKTEFAGRPLQSYYLAPVDRYFVSEESIQRMATRFVKWPSQEPAGPITIGETKDQRGFLAMSDAAHIVGVSPRTMWLWASQGKAPTDKPLDIVKCTTSDHFYIREKDAYALKKLIPRSGLQRGRRPHLSP